MDLSKCQDEVRVTQPLYVILVIGNSHIENLSSQLCCNYIFFFLGMHKECKDRIL